MTRLDHNRAIAQVGGDFCFPHTHGRLVEQSEEAAIIATTPNQFRLLVRFRLRLNVHLYRIGESFPEYGEKYTLDPIESFSHLRFRYRDPYHPYIQDPRNCRYPSYPRN